MTNPQDYKGLEIKGTDVYDDWWKEDHDEVDEEADEVVSDNYNDDNCE